MTSTSIVAESAAERTLLLREGVRLTHTLVGSEIYPEIPMPHWATSRYLDDEGRSVVDEGSASHEGFDIELSTAHARDGREQYEETLALWWTNEWAAGSRDRETCVILPARIPDMIAALQHAQAILAGEVSS